MSIDSPKTAEAMTEHSICQPGRPLPQGESQDGSPGLDIFQRAKSRDDRFSESSAERAPAKNKRAAKICRKLQDLADSNISPNTFSFLKQICVAHYLRYKFCVMVILIFVKLGDIKVNRSVGLVRKAVINDLLNESHIFRNVLGHAGQTIGTKYLEIQKRRAK